MPSQEQLPAGTLLMQTEWKKIHESVEPPQPPSAAQPPVILNQYLCKNPINPHMKSLSNRVHSFYSQQWNLCFLQATPEELADAGLFFTGNQ